MRITESQLRRIIRQEARRLTEMPAPLLKDVSLDKAAQLANSLLVGLDGRVKHHDPGQIAAELSGMLEYLRLNFDLVPKP